MAEFSRNDVSVTRRETLFQGFYRIDKLWLTHPRFEGGQVDIARELFLRPPAVGVLLCDRAVERVLLIEQFRVGALDDAHPWQFEVVAGLIEPGESREAVAVRETKEEAGVDITADDLTYVNEFLVSCGGSDERFTLYVAPADLDQAQGIHGALDEGEDIRVHVMTVEEALALGDSGRLNNVVGLLALHWLLRHRDRLRAQWA